MKAAAAPPTGARRRRFLALLVAVGTCSAIDRVGVITMGPAMAKDLALTDFQLGLTGGFAFALLYAVLGLPIARIADRGIRVRLISVSVLIWSLFLMISGLVRNFTQLLVARMIVGIGEAGVQPPAVSLVSDLYPREKRGGALGIMALGVPIGTVIGSIAGGSLTEALSWRAALLILGAPGLLLALVFALATREPSRGLCDPDALPDTETPALRAVVRRLAARRSFWHLLAAIGVANVAIFGLGAFLPQYFTRVVHLSLGQTGVIYGVVGAVSTIGYLFGGQLADRAGRRDARWQAWICAAGVLAGAPFYVANFHVVDPVLATVLLTIGGTCMFIYFTPTQLILQNMVDPKMRATAAFVFFFVSGLLGSGLGPPLVGLVSDMAAARHFAGDYGALCAAGAGRADGLAAVQAACADAAAFGVRIALTAASLLFFWAAAHFLLAARTLREDLG